MLAQRGDQKPDSVHFDWRTFAARDINIDFLKGKIREQTNVEIKFSVDGGVGGGNRLQQLELLKSFLDYYLRNVVYLPRPIPEDIIWNEEFARKQIENLIPDPIEAEQLVEELVALKETKKKFVFVANILQGKSTSDVVSSVHRQFIQHWLRRQNEDFEKIESTIQSIIDLG